MAGVANLSETKSHISLLCYRKEPHRTHEHHPIGPSLAHMPFLSWIYCKCHTQTDNDRTSQPAHEPRVGHPWSMLFGYRAAVSISALSTTLHIKWLLVFLVQCVRQMPSNNMIHSVFNSPPHIVRSQSWIFRFFLAPPTDVIADVKTTIVILLQTKRWTKRSGHRAASAAYDRASRSSEASATSRRETRECARTPACRRKCRRPAKTSPSPPRASPRSSPPCGSALRTCRPAPAKARWECRWRALRRTNPNESLPCPARNRPGVRRWTLLATPTLSSTSPTAVARPRTPTHAPKKTIHNQSKWVATTTTKFSCDRSDSLCCKPFVLLY